MTDPRSSGAVNSNDPVTLYLLTETAIGDSVNYEVLSFEEVEALKKELTILSTRIKGAKRKLALETKLRDAAQSLGRLYSPPSPRSSDGYPGNTQGESRGNLGQREASETLSKSDSELAMSQRRCEQQAQELWKLEGRAQKINQRLLEHTAGVLQMTHKGLKKGPKNPVLDNAYDGHEFDDRSLYRTTEHLDSFGVNGKIEPSAAFAKTEALQAMERRLEELSERMHDMMIQSNPGEFIDPPPQLSQGGGPVSPNATTEAYLAYIQNGLENIVLHRGAERGTPAAETGPEAEGAWKSQLTEINNKVQSLVDRFGLTRSPTLPPPPEASHGEGLEEQLSYLRTGVNGLESRVDKVLEQKSILTTQIQQQRELNSKSDAERDGHIGDLTSKLSEARKNLELSEREVSDARSAQGEAETELKRLQAHMDSLKRDDSARAVDVSNARDHAEEVERLQVSIRSLQEANSKSGETKEALDRAESEVQRLQAVIATMKNEPDYQLELEKAKEDRDLAEDAVKALQNKLESMHNNSDTRYEEAMGARERAEHEVAQLEAAINQVRTESETRVQEANAEREKSDETATKLQNEITELEGKVVRVTTELTMVKAELDGAYGTRAQRAAEGAPDPSLQKENDALVTRNIELTEELAALKSQRGGGDLQQRADTLEKELRETLDEYEAMTKASIEFEKERERFEGVIDSLRDRCEQLDLQLAEERINWMNLNSPTSAGRDGASETTSTMVLKNEFKKMMRDTRNENMKILRVSFYNSASLYSH